MSKASQFPDPSHGYTIKEFIGGGQHKLTFRASHTNQIKDVALIYLRNKNPELLAIDLRNLLEMDSEGDENAQYIAQMMGMLKGKDGQFFIIEELLSRPLDRVGEIDDLLSFARIARDLCRGLSFIHGRDMVHRDLKLDNFGVDSQGRAKIFDLGTLTKDKGELGGSYLTREPDLLDTGGRGVFDKAADVWAMGASLFALRVGDYPFVSQSQIQERRMLLTTIRDGTTKAAMEAKQKKLESDKEIASRATAKRSDQELRSRIEHTLQGTARTLLQEMLNFDFQSRKPASYFAKEWSGLADRLAATGGAPDGDGDFYEQAEYFLRLAERREISITRRQLESISESLRSVPGKVENQARAERVNSLVATIKESGVLADVRLSPLRLAGLD